MSGRISTAIDIDSASAKEQAHLLRQAHPVMASMSQRIRTLYRVKEG